MKIDPTRRDDISKFLVHLTRDTENVKALDNLISILKDKSIKAQTPHCLFKYEFERLKFSNLLTKKFNTVCFTEAPLHQIKSLVQNIPNRKIKLQPYGLVFWKHELLDKGANPAIYINSKGTNLKKLLLEDFKRQFENTNQYNKLKKEEVEYYDEIIQYYSLINIIDDNYNFSWEREWRFSGKLDFNYRNIVAIIAEDPEVFIKECSKQIDSGKMKYLKKVPVMSPQWNYEEVIEEMSCSLWRDFEPLSD